MEGAEGFEIFEKSSKSGRSLLPLHAMERVISHPSLRRPEDFEKGGNHLVLYSVVVGSICSVSRHVEYNLDAVYRELFVIAMQTSDL